jgi:hypothetical protein
MVEVGDEGSASLGLVGAEVFLELRILGLKQHGDLLGLLILKIGLLLGAVGGGVAGLIADGALDCEVVLGLEGAGPCAVALLLAVVAVVVVDALHLHVVAVQQVLQLLVLLSVQDLLDLIHALLQLVVSIRHNHDVQRLEVFKDVLRSLVSTPTSHGNLAS